MNEHFTRPSLQYPVIGGQRVRLSEADRLQEINDIFDVVRLDVEVLQREAQEAVFATLAAGFTTWTNLLTSINAACPSIDPVAAKLILDLMKAAGQIAQHGVNVYSAGHSTGASIGWPPIAVFPRTYEAFRIQFLDLLRENAGAPVGEQPLNAALGGGGACRTWIKRAIDEDWIEKCSVKGRTTYRLKSPKDLP